MVKVSSNPLCAPRAPVVNFRGYRRTATSKLTQSANHSFSALRARYGETYRWLLLLSVMVGTMASIMSSTIINVAIPDTKKHRIHDSEAARNAAQAAPLAASAEATAAADAAELKAQHDAFWAKFAENVMNHVVWPAVWAGHIRAAQKSKH